MVDLNTTAVTMTFSYQEIYALVPCLFLGIGVGISNFFKEYISHNEYKGTWQKLVGNALTSGVICFIVFALLDTTNLSFTTRLAIAAAVAFLGIDKFIEVVQKIINIKVKHE